MMITRESRTARMKYEKKITASFLARMKPGYNDSFTDVKVRWFSDAVQPDL